jgi:hypothetical protein
MKTWQKRKLKRPLKKVVAANITFKIISWTKHAEEKMRFYRLSKQRVRRVLNSPKRIEEGIAPNTLAMMQPVSVSWSQEIWVMIQKKRQDTIKIISAWRYPGRTKPRDEIAFNIIQQEYANYLAGDNFKD